MALDKVLIGARIRKIREELFCESRVDFARRCNLTERHIGQLERGEFLISLPSLDNIITATGVDTDFILYGKGENVRDWLYVEDHCRAIDLIIHKGRVGEVYNVGGHNEMKNIDIVKLICKELGKPESLITHVADRKGHDMRYAIDPTKIHNELGWLPETKFADGIKKTIKWYLDNKEWWETIISGEYQNYYEKMYGNREEVKA